MEGLYRLTETALLLMSFWGYFFIVCRFGKVKSWFVPIVCMAGISLVLFFGGLLGILALAADLALMGGLIGFIIFVVFLLRGKINAPKWSLCGGCFGVGAAVFLLLSLNLKLLHYDNFSHWALIVKYLLSTDHFPGADTVMIPFRDYPPGSSVFIYYVCRFAGWSQGVMLLAQNSMIIACFYAVFGIVKEQRRFLLYSFLGMGCALLSYLNLTIRINNLLVDLLLPLLAMASAAVSFRYCREKGKLCILQVILLGFIGIVKSTGVFFAGAAGIYALWMSIHTGKEDRKTESGKEDADKAVSFRRRGKIFGCGVLMLCGAALPSLAWRRHLNIDMAGFEGKFEMGKAAGEYGAPVGEELYGQVTRDFLETSFDLSGRSAQVFFVCLILAVGAVLYARFIMKKRWRLGNILTVGIVVVILYYAGMLYMYLYTMPAEEALRLAGFERYACSIMTLFAGVLIMGAAVDMEGSFAVDIDERGAYKAYSSPGARRRYQYAVLGTVLLGVNFLYSEVNGLRSIRADYETSLPGRVERAVGDRWYETGETDEKTYLVVASDENGQVSSGETQYVCRYFLWAPNVDAMESVSGEELERLSVEYDRIIVLD